MAVSVNINSLSVYTDHYFVPAIKDNFFLGSALWFKLRDVEEPIDGGDDIRFPISHSASTVAKRWAGRFSTVDLEFQDHATHGVVNPVQYVTSISLADTDIAKNRGRAKLINLIKAQSELAEKSLRDKMGIDVFLDGSGSPAGLTGLASIIAFGAGSYAGIDRTGATGNKNGVNVGNAFFNANVMAANFAGTRDFWKASVTMDASTVLTTAKMQAIFGVCTIDRMKPNLIVTSQVLYDKYHSLLTLIQRQMTDDTLGKFGFDSLTYNGVPVVVDDNIDAVGKMYFLNLDTFCLCPYQEMNFKATPFRYNADQLAQVKLISWMGNVYCDRPNANGALTGLTAV